MLHMISSFWNLTRLALWSIMRCILESVLQALEKNEFCCLQTEASRNRVHILECIIWGLCFLITFLSEMICPFDWGIKLGYSCVTVAFFFMAVVLSLSHAWFFVTPSIATRQASLSTITRSLLKLMSIESVMPSNYLIPVIPFSSCLKSSPASESLPMSQHFTLGGRSIGDSASASVLPKNIQDWFPLGLTGLIS